MDSNENTNCACSWSTSVGKAHKLVRLGSPPHRHRGKLKNAMPWFVAASIQRVVGDRMQCER